MVHDQLSAVCDFANKLCVVVGGEQPDVEVFYVTKGSLGKDRKTRRLAFKHD
jgi:hypothetical protein